MKKINGYSLAVKLCEYSTLTGTGLSFPALCKIFGPMYWETLNPLEKLYYKRLAAQYKQTDLGIAERKGKIPTRTKFLNAIFGNKINEQNEVLDELENIVFEIKHLESKY